MRLQLLGSYTLEEFQEAMSKIIDDFKISKIDSFRNVNLYMHPCSKGRTTPLLDEGQEIEHMIYDFGGRREVSKISGELSIIKSHVLNENDSDKK